MPRIRCHYMDCAFIDDGYCSAAAVEIDPDTGCNTYSPNDDVSTEEDWSDEDELESWDEVDSEDDDMWIEEDEF